VAVSLALPLRTDLGLVRRYDEASALAREDELDEAQAQRREQEDGVAPAHGPEETLSHAFHGGVQLGIRKGNSARRRTGVIVGPDESGFGAERVLVGPYREVLVDHRLIGAEGVVVLG
jgi:hypothetical protein